MSEFVQIHDPAFPVMAMDLFGSVLNRADNPAAVGSYLAEAIRNLTGAGCVVFLRVPEEGSDGAPSVFSFHPPKRQIWLESAGGRRLLSLLSGSDNIQRHAAGDDTVEGEALKQEGLNGCLILPLRVGSFKVGSLLLLGLQSGENDHRVQEILGMLSTLVALVLRNAFLYERQEQTIALRTKELQSANDALALTQHSIDQANDAIFWLRADSSIASCNRATTWLLGCSWEELRDKHAYDFVMDRDPAGWGEHWGTVRRMGSLTREMNLKTARGLEIPVEVSETYVLFGNKEFICAIARDLTERHKLEAQLAQAQKMEAIGQLAGGIAHDFNNILAAMMLQVGLLTGEAGLTAEAVAALKEINEGAKRASDMTKQLLMFSRRSVLSIQPVRLDQLVGNLLKMLRRLLGELVEIEICSEKDLPLVSLDPRMTELVVMNLAINARDAMPKGGKIRIFTERVNVSEGMAAVRKIRRPGSFVCLSVQDNGTGMDEETQSRIFEPFFTTKEPGKGTGLGLASVQGIVSQHQGWIEVESTLHKGTCFKVFFPEHENQEYQEEDPDEMICGGDENILLVEDEAPLRFAAKAALQHFGYTIHVAENGVKALEIWMAHSDKIRLIVTDSIMPGGFSGVELATQLLQIQPSLGVIITSGYIANPPEMDALMQKGATFLPKPYDIQSLAQMVRKVLDRVRT